MAFEISQQTMELEQFLLDVQRSWLDVRGSDEPIVRIGETILPVSEMIALVQLREHAHSRDALAQAARVHTRVDRKIGNFILRTYFVDGQPDAWDVYRCGGRRIGTYKTSEGAQRAIARWEKYDAEELTSPNRSKLPR